MDAGTRNAKYMRSSLGFFPLDRSQSKAFNTLNAKCLEFLKTNKINGRNARAKYAEIAAFSENEAEFLFAEQILDSQSACKTLAFATVFAAIGSYEAYLSRKREKK
jgi:hypothetical protein